MTTAVSRPTVRLDALTSIRFFAALYVCVFHLRFSRFFVQPHVQGFLDNGYLGVPFFFVLSGFILAYTYAQPGTGDRVDKRSFWVARLARIYPVYLVGLAVSLASFLKILVHHHSLRNVVRVAICAAMTITGAQSLLPKAATSWNVPAWSVSVEAFFYLLFPFVVLPIQKMSRRSLLLLASTAWMVSATLSLIYILSLPHAYDADVHSKTVGILMLKFHPLARLPEFIIGVCLGCAFLRRPQRARSGDLLVVAALSLLATALFFVSYIPYPLLHNALLAPAFALLIYGLGCGGRIASVLSHRWLVFGGGVSYSLYLLHWSLFGIFADVGTLLGMETRTLAFATLQVLAAIAVSILVFKHIEVPARSTVRKRLAPVQEQQARAATVGS